MLCSRTTTHQHHNSFTFSPSHCHHYITHDHTYMPQYLSVLTCVSIPYLETCRSISHFTSVRLFSSLSWMMLTYPLYFFKFRCRVTYNVLHSCTPSCKLRGDPLQLKRTVLSLPLQVLQIYTKSSRIALSGVHITAIVLLLSNCSEKIMVRWGRVISRDTRSYGV